MDEGSELSYRLIADIRLAQKSRLDIKFESSGINDTRIESFEIRLFDRNAGGMSQSDENFIAKDIVCMITECVAIWNSDQMADDDLLVWTEIKNTVH